MSEQQCWSVGPTGRRCGELVASGRPLAALIVIPVFAQCLVSAHGEISSLVPALADRGLQAAALGSEPGMADLERGHGIVTRLRDTPGLALVEDPGFELAAGKQIVGNATHLRNLYLAGLWRPDNLVADLVGRRYHAVVLDAELYPEAVLTAIGRHYFLYDTVAVYRARQLVFLPGAS